MRYIATFDIGTTAVKGVLLSTEGTPVFTMSIGIETIFKDDYREQDPKDWYKAFSAISKELFLKGYNSGDIIGIIMSGQMQDLIPVDMKGLPVCNAILYSDGRAGEQAKEIAELVGLEKIVESTGNNFDGSLTFPKLLWLNQNCYYDYQRTAKILISSKDYVIAQLTGCFVTDVVSASTTGIMDIQKKRWNTAWLQATGIDADLLPKLLHADEQAGCVTEKAASETGYAVGTPVYAGSGDAGAATLASGISADGEFSINLGTSGWVASVSSNALMNKNVFNLAAMPRDSYINVVPFFNAGNVHKWIGKTLVSDNEENEKYDYIDKLLDESVPGSHGLMFLPYIVGERFPVIDTQVRGGFIGVTPETTKQDMARSCLEGVAFSIRQGIENIGRRPCKISLIGGGAQVKVWCQILADMLDHEVIVYSNSEFLPAMAIASSVLIAQELITDYRKFTEELQHSNMCNCYKPDSAAVALYNSSYNKYLSIYPAFKMIK